MRSERVAILCGGPSMADHELSRIDCDTIGTNLSFKAMQADIQVFTYGKLMKKWETRLVDETPGARQRFSVYRIEGCFQPRMIWNYRYQCFLEGKKIPRFPEDYDVFEDGWVLSGGGPCALQVAVSYGYREIVFLGLDLNIKAGYHFYPETDLGNARHPKHTDGGNPEKGAFRQQAEFFRQVEPWLTRMGIRVFNTNAESLETTFEKREFKSFWT